MLFCAYFTFLPVMVLTRMHERYLHPVLVFLLLLAALAQLKTLSADEEERSMRFVTAPFMLYVLVTMLHTINLYQVYEYYQHFPDPVPATNRLYTRIAGSIKVWAVLTLMCFVALVAFLPSWLPGARRRAEDKDAPQTVLST